MELWYFLCGNVIGLIIGSVVIAVRTCKTKITGTLRVDHSNPGKDMYRLEIEDLNALSRKKRLILKIDNQADLSQE